MKIHEYQAKSILKKYGIPIQDGEIIESLTDELLLGGVLSAMVRVKA